MRRDVPNAARFEIAFDGRTIGRFEALLAHTTPGAAPRPLQVHELPLAWQKSAEVRTGKVTLWDHTFEVPGSGEHAHRQRETTFVVKRGTCSGERLEHWRTLGRGNMLLSGLDPGGRPIVRYRFSGAWVTKITGPTLPSRGGGDVAIEEIVIAYEQVSLA